MGRVASRTIAASLMVSTVMAVCGPMDSAAQAPAIEQRAVSAPGPGRPPLVRVGEAGPDDNYEFLAYDSGFRGGVFVAAANLAGDDGVDEIVTGADAGGGPHVRVFGKPGVVRLGFMAYPTGFRGGVRVASGDVDGDGFNDIITAPGPGGGPHVKVFDRSGKFTGVEFMAFPEQFRGGAYVTVGQWDEDAPAEIIVGAGEGGGPHIKAFDVSCSGDSCAAQPADAGIFAYDAAFRGGVRVGSSGVGTWTAPGPGGGPHVRYFGRQGKDFGDSFMAYDPSFRGGVYVGPSWSMVTTGPDLGGGPHVREVRGVRDGNVTSHDFLAFEEMFTGGVRVTAADVVASSESSAQ